MNRSLSYREREKSRRSFSQTILLGGPASAVAAAVLGLVAADTSVAGLVVAPVLLAVVDGPGFGDLGALALPSGGSFLGALEGLGHDVLRQVQGLPQVSDALLVERPVEVLPDEDLLDQVLGF